MTEQQIKTQTELEHVLHNPGMYIGSTKAVTRNLVTLEDGKFIRKDMRYVPGILKLIEEIFTNAIDEAIRTDFKFANKIDIEMTNKSVKVSDNGRGIPQSKNEDGDVQAIVAFTKARTGGNFHDKGAKGGMHGLGAFLTNAFSNFFYVETCDGKNVLSFECRQNMSKTSKASFKKSTKRGTSIYFEPNFNLFDIDSLDGKYYNLVKNELYHVACQYPKIQFSINWKGPKEDSIVEDLF